MTTTPRISIITIAYNVRDELRRTIDSVNAQSYPAIEHVIVDGGSTDGSVELARHRARREPRIVSERDAGISDAFNKGTRLATGEYVCYLNAGDAFAAPDVVARFAAQVSADAEARPTVYVGDFISSHHGAERLHRTNCAIEAFAWENPINHQSAFIPRALALQHPYDPRLRLGMDYDFWLRVMPLARFRKLPFVVARFDLGGRSSAPEWQVHGMVVRRLLWHASRGSRFGLSDLLVIGARALRFRAQHAVRRLLGRRVSLALRQAKSRWSGRSPATEQSFA